MTWKRTSRQLLKQQEVLGGYDPAQYECERLWATARDGVKVPISIVYKKGFKRDGTAPMWLYAYGSYGVGLSPSFSSDRVSLLDRGMSFAIAHVRGGNEMGEAWREAGMLMNKKNTFNDFIDCAEFLIQEKWTTNDRLVIEGASAGGLLVGAVVNMRPDLFGAVLCSVPFVDVMNTMMDASLPLTTGEYMVWGDPHAEAGLRLHEVVQPLRQPGGEATILPMLVTTGLNDSQVMYWEPTKYVARLRTLKTDDNPLLLKVKMSAGHGGSSGRYDQLKEQAFEYAWLLSQVGHYPLKSGAAGLTERIRGPSSRAGVSRAPSSNERSLLPLPWAAASLAWGGARGWPFARSARFAHRSVSSSHACGTSRSRSSGSTRSCTPSCGEMFDLMYAAKGVGLAANQVDLPYRLFIINLESRSGGRRQGIRVHQSRAHQPQGKRRGRGGLPEPARLVRRRETPGAGRAQRLQPGRPGSDDGARGLFARAVQHEIDHLDGILFIDRLSPTGEMAVKDALADFEIEFAGQRERGEIPDDEDDRPPPGRAGKTADLTNSLMRLIMMGTGPFAVPTLARLYDSRHEVLALVTRPPRVLHGKTQADVNPMRELAVARGTPIHEPESINTPLRSRRAGQLSARSVRGLRLRSDSCARDAGDGAAGGHQPARLAVAQVSRRRADQWAIYHGETETGVTMIHMTPRVDAGPAIAQARTPIGPRGDGRPAGAAPGRAGRAAGAGRDRRVRSRPRRDRSSKTPAQATRAPRLTKELGQVDWSRSAAAIHNQVRALQPWPKTYTFGIAPAASRCG